MLTGIPAADMIGTGNHREAFYVRRRELMADLIVRRAGTYDFSMLYGGKFKGSQLIKNGYEGEEFFPKLGENGKWLFFTAAPLKDDHGNVIGAIETIQDITDRRLADQALRTSEARYHQLLNLPMMPFLFSRTSRLSIATAKPWTCSRVPDRKCLACHPSIFRPGPRPTACCQKMKPVENWNCCFTMFPNFSNGD
jgi:hypothetical protein